MNRWFVLMVGLVTAIPLACADDGQPLDSDSGDATFDAAAAEAYCTDNGGLLVLRVATWNTNADPSAQLEMAGRMTFCEFESDEESPSRISVDLVTLYSEEPTIAAVAYLSEVATTDPEVVGQNPAEYSCKLDLAGSSDFGNTATVGGWVNSDEPVFNVIQMCVFADFSAIDEFGLWYHANGEIRGVDLAPILRYQPGRKLPAMFESNQ